jgi:large-conductance mechanosensitive channel
MHACNYFIGNLAMLGSNIPTIYIGATISDVSNIGSSQDGLGYWKYVLLAAGFVIVVIVIFLVACYARREFKRTMVKIKEEQEKAEAEAEKDTEANLSAHDPEI